MLQTDRPIHTCLLQRQATVPSRGHLYNKTLLTTSFSNNTQINSLAKASKLLTVNKHDCMSAKLRLLFKTLGGPETIGTDSWLDDTDSDKKFGQDLPFRFKMHELWPVDSDDILKLLPPDVRF